MVSRVPLQLVCPPDLRVPYLLAAGQQPSYPTSLRQSLLYSPANLLSRCFILFDLYYSFSLSKELLIYSPPSLASLT